MPFQIRPATNADVPGVVDVIHTVYDEYSFTWEPDGYHKDLYDIEGHYDGQDDRFYVAVIDGFIVGTVAIALFDLIAGDVGQIRQLDGFLRVQGCDCALERLYVHPKARRTGVGSGLLKHTFEIARAENRQAMELWSDKKFVDAHRLYGKLGAKVVGERLCHDPDQSPEWGLMIDLTRS